MGYVFVGGSPRSGTSMLQLLLCQFERTNPMLRDVTYLRGLVTLYEAALEDFANDTHYYFDDVGEFQSFHAGLVETFLERQLSRFPGAEHLVLKDAPLTRFFPLLFELVPTARFVLIVRDPRDAIASMITVGEKMKAVGQRHLFQDRNPLKLCEYFKGYYRSCFHSTDPAFRERTLLVKYEDVVRHPEVVMPRLSAFTGLAFQFDPASPPDAGAVDYAKVEEKHRCWHTDRFGKAVDPSSVGRYQQILTSGEAEEIARLCQDIMDQFGYG